MPHANVAEHLEACKKRYQITEELASRGLDDSDAGAMSTWYNLDVGMLLAQNQRLRAALEGLVAGFDGMMGYLDDYYAENPGYQHGLKSLAAARRALEQQP